jgi:exonuclease III
MTPALSQEFMDRPKTALHVLGMRSTAWSKVGRFIESLNIKSTLCEKMSRTLITFIAPLLFFVVHSSAETLRVITWNLEEARGNSVTNALDAAATALKNIDPDVILLQQVRDWPMCMQLAQALNPAAYSVLVCSRFRQPISTGANCQVAILSKHKAYFSWSEAWRTEDEKKALGGFVFAAIEARGYRVALFSVDLNDRLLQSNGAGSYSACRQQWIDGVDSFRKWVNNRPVSAVVAGSLLGDVNRASNTGAPFQRAEPAWFANEFLAAAIVAAPPQAEQRFATRLTASSGAFPGVVLGHSRQTCDLELELAEPPAISSTSPESPEIKVPNSNALAQSISLATNISVSRPTVQTSSLPDKFYWLTLTPAMLLLLGIFIWLLTRRASRQLDVDLRLRLDSGLASATDGLVSPSSAPSISSSDAQAISAKQDQALIWQQRALAAEQQAQRANDLIRAGLITCMREWLKQKLFRKLINDRTALLETQQVATFKALAVDERLSRIELQLQQQNQAYEQRIERLVQELRVTKEESRALIRAQIVQIKAEMEAARAKLLAEAEQHAMTE